MKDCCNNGRRFPNWLGLCERCWRFDVPPHPSIRLVRGNAAMPRRWRQPAVSLTVIRRFDYVTVVIYLNIDATEAVSKRMNVDAKTLFRRQLECEVDALHFQVVLSPRDTKKYLACVYAFWSVYVYGSRGSVRLYPLQHGVGNQMQNQHQRRAHPVALPLPPSPSPARSRASSSSPIIVHA